MISFEQLIQPRSGHGLQSMMRRWEQLHPVNAVHVVELSRFIPGAAIKLAAARVFRRLLQIPAEAPCPAPEQEIELFEFSEAWAAGDQRRLLESKVTEELNTRFDDGQTPFRIRVIHAKLQQQFLVFSYRHVVADARGIALVMRELLEELGGATADKTTETAFVDDHTLRDLFPAEFCWRRAVPTTGHLVREWWQSQCCLRLIPRRYDDLRMEFLLHESALPLANLKAACREYCMPVNDLLLAALFEWFANRFTIRRAIRPFLAVATLADLSCRGSAKLPRAFGQFVSQFVIRAAIPPHMPFGQIVQMVRQQSAALKQNEQLIDQSIGFEVLSRLWDWLPCIRQPRHLTQVLPLVAGISNVNLASIWGSDGMPNLVQNYFRGTCVTNIVPMMLTITSINDSVSLSTTHRSALFSAQEMSEIAEHVKRRLFGKAVQASEPAEWDVAAA